ncbi:MAG TPA: aquaporin [Bacteroidia bacterium]|jgi:aquaporin Z
MNKYIIESIGTFFLVAAIGLTGNPLAIGAMLMVMVYMGGSISGAQYNPAITLALWIRGKMTAAESMIYMVMQLLGALASAFFIYLIYHGTFTPLKGINHEINILKPLAIEMVFTFALALVVLTVATSKKNAGNSYFGLAIGFTVCAAAFAGGPISGGAYNPAVGIGPSLIDMMFGSGKYMKDIWIYIVGPFAGAAVAAIVYKLTNPDEFAA